MRGAFNFFSSENYLKKTPRMWQVNVLSADCFWFDLIINAPSHADTKQFIANYLSELKKKIEQTLERRFIYFIATRKKVRFDTSRPPRYELFTKKLILTFVLGKDRRKVKRKLVLRDEQTGTVICPKITIDEKFIRIWKGQDASITLSVHDFIRSFGINLRIDSHVHYVGITRNPHERPISLEHGGLARVWYNVSHDENDSFLFVNLFKVVARTSDRSSAIQLYVANAITDEVPVDPEGAIIEHSLVAYFNSPIQREEKSNERARLTGNLDKLRNDKNIVGVLFDLELSEPDEYFRFFS